MLPQQNKRVRLASAAEETAEEATEVEIESVEAAGDVAGDGMNPNLRVDDGAFIEEDAEVSLRDEEVGPVDELREA